MSSKLVVGIDLGATNVRAALGSLDQGIIKSIGERTIQEPSAEKLIEQLISLVERVAGEKLGEIQAIGMGSIGPLDIWKGVILNPSNAPFRDVPVTEALSERFKVPAYLLNDCTVAVLGETVFGAGKNLKNVFYVTLSSGIGGGAVVDGNLLLGKDGNAVEIGHIVIDFDGKLKCGCGARGHWESYCAGKNIPSFARYWITVNKKESERSPVVELALKGELTTEYLFNAAKTGDKIALEIVEEIGRLNAIGFANITTLYDPELITVGGAIAVNNESLVLEPIRRHLQEYTVNRVPEVKLTPLGDEVVLYGAVALAINPPEALRSLKETV